ncbi:MAG: nucleotidyltransferase family protein [Candidatus Omnitrophica bacterium]|nr:nucleotidyltransferase family protein [Candidatus Omnitrophota bacterium]
MQKPPSELRLILLCSTLNIDESAQQELRSLFTLPLNWEKIKKQANAQKLTPLLYANLNKCGLLDSLPQEIAMSFRQIYLANLQRNLVIEKEILRIVELASSQGIRIILLKGLALIYTLYKDYALRIMVDADMFIQKEDFLSLKDIFLQLGYKANEEAIKNYAQKDEYELMFSKKAFKEQFIYIDLHWRLLPSRPYLLQLPKAWERAEKIALPGHEVFSLSDEDNFLYLTLHLRRHVRDLTLNSIVDIAEYLKVKGQALDWDYIEDNARSNHFFSSIFFVLYLCRELFATEVSPEVMNKFKVMAVRRFLLKLFLNKDNFFSFKRWKGACVRLLLFDNPVDFFLYLWRVSLYERHFAKVFSRSE